MQNTNRTILSVTDLNSEVNLMLNRGFSLLWVEGEISNLSQPSSGHIYFSLKDNKAQIRCAMFRNRNMKLNIQPKNGMKVLVRGRVGLYEPRGDYQLIAEHMEDAGVGELQRQFEALKQKLSDSGLFDDSHKKAFPEYPSRIAVITSPTGAALQDILNVLKRRSPQTPVLVYPVAVQGASAKTQIEVAIRKADSNKKCDVIILARGGGSLEDLWSFNEENVAKAIYHAETPIICGVGHEIDFTIADFAADLRAPTPSAAAELITENKDHLLTDITQTQLWLKQTINSNIQQKQQKLDWLSSRLQLQKPSNKIQQQSQHLDDIEARLKKQITLFINERQIRLTHLKDRVQSHQPFKKIQDNRQRLAHVETRLLQSINQHWQNKQSQFLLQMAKLDSISPLNTLKRGYAIAYKNDNGQATGKFLVTSINNIDIDQQLVIQLKDGEVNTKVLSKSSPSN